MNTGRLLRLFVAVELPPETRSALRQLIERLRASIVGPFRWVSADGIHLTLKFLGDVPGERVDELGAALDQAAHGHAPFELVLSALGVFPHRQSPRVLWVGLAGEVEALQAVQLAVEQHVSKLSFPAESRRFTPHLTLARVNGRLSQDQLVRLQEALEQAERPAGNAFRVASVALIQSTLTPSSAVYQRLREVPLRRE